MDFTSHCYLCYWLLVLLSNPKPYQMLKSDSWSTAAATVVSLRKSIVVRFFGTVGHLIL